MNDRLNPIFVYEIRQAVRNRALLVLLCLYMVLLIAVFVSTFPDIFHGDAVRSADAQVGRQLAVQFLAVLFQSSLLASLMFGVFTTIHQGLYDELLYATPLNSKGILVGKLSVSVFVSTSFYCVSMPFLVAAWLFRGVDILFLAIALPVVFLAQQVVTLYMAGAFVGCRSGLDVWAGAAGLLLGLPVCLIFWAGVQGIVLTGVYHAVPVQSQTVLIAAVDVGILLAITAKYAGQLYRELYKTTVRVDHRVYYAAGTPWIILFNSWLFCVIANLMIRMLF